MSRRGPEHHNLEDWDGGAGPAGSAAGGIPRAVLDARLVERAVAAGAVLRTHRVTSLANLHAPRAPGVPVVSGEVSADVPVGADGELLPCAAVGLVNPMTVEGIHYAVATGIAAGRIGARLAGGLLRSLARPQPSEHAPAPDFQTRGG